MKKKKKIDYDSICRHLYKYVLIVPRTPTEPETPARYLALKTTMVSFSNSWWLDGGRGCGESSTRSDKVTERDTDSADKHSSHA